MSCKTDKIPDASRHKRDFFDLYLRSCDLECQPPLACSVSGSVPIWLKGLFLRNGPGMRIVGEDEYKHFFDGLALMQSFKIEGGIVTYQNKFLKSDSFVKNQKFGRIVVSEFGTRAVPDPCMTLLQRFMKTLFLEGLFTDNDNVTFCPIGDSLYAVTDSPFIRRIDPQTLETKEKVDLRKHVAVNTSTSHAHVDPAGNTYNIGSNIGTYNIVVFPAKGGLDQGSILAKIPASNPLSPGYYHSFAITDKYFVFIEQPLVISIPHVLWYNYTGGTNGNILKWRPKSKVRFFVVDRKTNDILTQVFLSEPFAFFHTINAFEEENHLILDICTYEDGNFLKCLFHDSIKEGNTCQSQRELRAQYLRTKAERYVLPLCDLVTRSIGENINELVHSSAQAILQADGSIKCVPEQLTSHGPGFGELPTINYQRFNGRKYQFFYSLARPDSSDDSILGLMKCDTVNKTCLYWSQKNFYPSEPMFVPRQTEGLENEEELEEDDGVILSLVNSEINEKELFLLILDGKSFEEICRAEVTAPCSIPAGFHGYFIQE